MIPRLLVGLALSALFASACGPAEGHAAMAGRAVRDTLTTRRERLDSALARHDSGREDKELARWIMPDALYEISGITLVGPGRLFAHEDQTATVYEIDYRRGVVLKRFSLGENRVKGDFEGIAAAGDRIFLFTSTGVLFEFREGKDHARVPFTIRDTKLGAECEFEGVTFDPKTDALILACKVAHMQDAGGNVVLYRWPMSALDNGRTTRVLVPIEHVEMNANIKALHPSDITIDPFTGDYVLVASKEHAIIGISPEGKMLY
ncbi:MAG TPA: hypothetical protein VE967_02320, partial [Gemmatimonadaceae bacterium]|nr:hypothetical protein [Gemmatimonadaceae bacterium]